MVKFTDAELHQAAKLEAAKHGAEFLGAAATYKYGRFRLACGQEVDMHLYHVRAGKWPTDVKTFLARQASSRGRNSEKMLARLKELAESAGARLRDENWEGPHHWYSFQLADGRTVQIRGSKLMISGWPRDIDTYLRWSADRCQGDAQPKTNEQLFTEFRATVEANNATVVAAGWEGARVPHEVLLSDGTIRRIKPNQLKYFGWPAVPLDELRKMASPYPVQLLSAPGRGPQVFRIVLVGGLYLEGTFAELKTAWGDGAQDVVLEAARWAASNALKLLPGRWVGVLAEYDFETEGGAVIQRQMPDAEAHEARRLNNEGLAKLRRVGTMHKTALVSQVFQGKEAEYEWERSGQVFRATTDELIDQSKAAAKLEQLRARVEVLGLGLVLLDTEWQGMCAPYRWRTAAGKEVTAKLSQLRRTGGEQVSTACGNLSRSAEARLMATGSPEKILSMLRCSAEVLGLKFLSIAWAGVDAAYLWELPDGSQVTATLKKLRNCARTVLRGRDVQAAGAAKVLPEECEALRWRVANSKSR